VLRRADPYAGSRSGYDHGIPGRQWPGRHIARKVFGALVAAAVVLLRLGSGRLSVVEETQQVARSTGVGRALATYEIPIEGRDEWLATARRLA
jgi:hypothetical protein